MGGYVIPGGDTIRWLFGDGQKKHKHELNGTKTNEPKNAEGQAKTSGIPMVGAGVSSFWHEMQLIRIGRGEKPDLKLQWVIGFIMEFFWWGFLRGGPVSWIGGAQEDERKRR